MESKHSSEIVDTPDSIMVKHDVLYELTRKAYADYQRVNAEAWDLANKFWTVKGRGRAKVQRQIDISNARKEDYWARYNELADAASEALTKYKAMFSTFRESDDATPTTL